MKPIVAIFDMPTESWTLVISLPGHKPPKTEFLMTRLRYEPAHEIMALFVLRKLILQTRMHGHPVGLDV